MRKVLLYIAQTLDGYIATKDHDLSFLDQFNDYPDVVKSFETLNERVDVEIMGRKTYDWMMKHANLSETRTVYVITHYPLHHENAIGHNGDFKKLIDGLKSHPGKDIWLVGGGEIIKSFIEQDLIDEYQIAILPILIGDGIRLFLPVKNEQRLKLIQTELLGDIVLLTYQKN